MWRPKVNKKDSTNAAITWIFWKKGNEQKFRLCICRLNLVKKNGSIEFGTNQIALKQIWR